MATPFEEIIDLAMLNMKDYKLDIVYREDINLFKEIMSGYLIIGSTNFQSCMQSLDFDLDTQEFLSDLTTTEKVILAKYAVLEWYTNGLNDVLEFKEVLKDSDFAKYSTGQNIRPRQDYIQLMRQNRDQDINDYLFNNDEVMKALKESMGYV